MSFGGILWTSCCRREALSGMGTVQRLTVLSGSGWVSLTEVSVRALRPAASVAFPG